MFIEINTDLLKSIKESCVGEFGVFVNAFDCIYGKSGENAVGLGGSGSSSLSELVFDLHVQDSFVICAEQCYRYRLIKLVLNIDDGILDSPYTETPFNPARYCAYLQGLENANKVVDALCENVILFAEIIYHM